MSDAGGSSSSNSSLDSAVAPPPSPVKGDKQHTNSRMSKTSAILRYSHQNDAAAVRRLLDEDPSFVSVRDDDSRTPLHVAAFHGSIDVAKTLIEFGAEINAQDRWKNTPLDDAHEAEKDVMIEFLTSSGGLSYDQDESHFEAPELEFSISSLFGTVFNDMIEALFGFLSHKLVLVCIACSILITSVVAKPSKEEYDFYKSLNGLKGMACFMGIGVIAAFLFGALHLSGRCAKFFGDRWFGDPEIPISTGPRRTRSWMRGWKNPLQRPIAKYFNPVFASQELHDKLF